MIDTLSIFMTVVFFIFVTAGSVSASVGTIFIWKLVKNQATSALAAEFARKEIIQGQMNIAEIISQASKGLADFQNEMGQKIIDSQYDVVEKNTEDILKVSRDNSQKVYDAVFVLIQMMNGYLTQAGYQPPAPSPDAGLEDPKKGSNYYAPPAQDVGRQEGLTFNRY